jgi:IclR family transcriptional regulator, KDG regulon repressor
MQNQNGESPGAKAVQRALDILSSFTLETPQKGVSEISEETGLSKGSVHRLLMALMSKRCVIHDPVTGKYQLGTKVLELAGVLYANRLSYQERARPHLQRLVEDINETVVVNARDGDSHICTLVIDAARPVRFFTRVGVRRRPHFGAAGQALLAWESKEALELVLPSDKLEAFTLLSITDRGDYLRRLRQVREQGYALDRGETFPDVTGLGAPIFDHTGQVIASVSIVAPTHRVPDDRLPDLIDKLLRATARISAELGAPPSLLGATYSPPPRVNEQAGV